MAPVDWTSCGVRSSSSSAGVLSFRRVSGGGRRKSLFGGGGGEEEDRAAAYGFSHVFFFRPRISANKRGGRVEFSEAKDVLVGTATARCRCGDRRFSFFYLLLVAVIIHLSFFSTIFPITMSRSFRARRFNASPNPSPFLVMPLAEHTNAARRAPRAAIGAAEERRGSGGD